MKPRLHYDPFSTGPQPLLSDRDRPYVEALVSKLESNLTAAIVKAVSEGAEPLFRRGYRLNELKILGYGPEITVEPKAEVWRITLWWRRVLLKLQIRTIPAFQKYGEMEADDYDTQRLITQLKIFENYPGVYPDGGTGARDSAPGLQAAADAASGKEIRKYDRRV